MSISSRSGSFHLVVVAIATFAVATTVASLSAQYPYPDAGYVRPGEVRVNVKPSTAAVYVDGYYAGRVDDYDGPFQRLYVEPGQHEFVVYAPGHRTLRQ